jgi:hypothetical protein
MRPPLDPSQTLKEVIHWQNDMVLAFDQNGKQIPALQGKHSEVWLDIARASTPELLFGHIPERPASNRGRVGSLAWRMVGRS